MCAEVATRQLSMDGRGRPFVATMRSAAACPRSSRSAHRGGLGARSWRITSSLAATGSEGARKRYVRAASDVEADLRLCSCFCRSVRTRGLPTLANSRLRHGGPGRCEFAAGVFKRSVRECLGARPLWALSSPQESTLLVPEQRHGAIAAGPWGAGGNRPGICRAAPTLGHDALRRSMVGTHGGDLLAAQSHNRWHGGLDRRGELPARPVLRSHLPGPIDTRAAKRGLGEQASRGRCIPCTRCGGAVP